MAAISVGDWGGRAPKARVSSAVGARIEDRGSRIEDRGAEGGMGVTAPYPENFSIFELKKARFGAFWEAG